VRDMGGTCPRGLTFICARKGAGLVRRGNLIVPGEELRSLGSRENLTPGEGGVVHLPRRSSIKKNSPKPAGGASATRGRLESFMRDHLLL